MNRRRCSFNRVRRRMWQWRQALPTHSLRKRTMHTGEFTSRLDIPNRFATTCIDSRFSPCDDNHIQSHQYSCIYKQLTAYLDISHAFFVICSCFSNLWRNNTNSNVPLFLLSLVLRSVSSIEATVAGAENQSSPSLPLTQSTKPNNQELPSQAAEASGAKCATTPSDSTSESASNAINASNMNKLRKPMTIESLNFLDEPSLNRLIDHCKKTNTFAPLIRNLGRYFSSRDLLVQSFQKRPTAHIDELLQKAPKDLKKLKKEDFRTLEGDLDKDVDSSCTETGATPTTATTTFRKRNNRDVPRHYTSVDLPSLRRAMSKLLETKSSAFDSLNNAMQSLAMGISVDLRMQTQRDKIEEIITVFVIVFEIIIIGKSDFVDVALPSICQAAAYLPVWAQARLAAIWAEHCKEGLRKLLETLQQLISLQVITGAYHENAYVQDNEIIISATKLMKVKTVGQNCMNEAK